MDNDKVTLTLNQKEFELVINAVAQLPYVQCAALLNKMIQEANARQDSSISSSSST